MISTFDYGLARVSDLRIQTEQNNRQRQAKAVAVEVDGRRTVPTQRFWKSFFLRFGINDNVFRYFDHAEVLERISERAPHDTFRFCIQSQPEGAEKLLAISSPSRPVIEHAETMDLVRRYGAKAISYGDGVVTSTHVPRSGEAPFAIAGDEFKQRFVMETPIDGFGAPKIYLSLLRLVCSNGAVGYSPAFRSEISVGKDIAHCVVRALESYDNDEGFSALRQRFESAQRSWASLHECQTLHKTIVRAHDNGWLRRRGVLSDFYRVTGNLNEIYGLANLDALNVKRQRVLPAKCRVYDVLNFATELASHHATPEGARVLQAYVGNLISDEYDMEGTAEKVTDFQDFFVAAPPGHTPCSVN